MSKRSKKFEATFQALSKVYQDGAIKAYRLTGKRLQNVQDWQRALNRIEADPLARRDPYVRLDAVLSLFSKEQRIKIRKVFVTVVNGDEYGREVEKHGFRTPIAPYLEKAGVNSFAAELVDDYTVLLRRVLFGGGTSFEEQHRRAIVSKAAAIKDRRSVS